MDWDSNWIPQLSDDHFKVQIDWELDALEHADIIAMVFKPSSKSPISLLDFGLYARAKKLIVFLRQ
jgi:hypothetical protein